MERRPGGIVGLDAAHHHHPSRRGGCRCAALQDLDRLGVAPVTQHLAQDVHVGPRGQRVEEALAAHRHPAGHARGPECVGRPPDGAGQVHQRPVEVGVGAQERRQEAPRAAADVHHRAHWLPTAGNGHIGIRFPVAWRSHEGVKAGRHQGVGGEVLPEGQPERVPVAGLAGPHIGQEGSPSPRHAPADAVEVEEGRGGLQLPGPVVAGEEAGSGFLEDAGAHQVSQDRVEGPGVAAGRRGQLLHLHRPGGLPAGQVIADAQGRHHVDAPGGAQVAQPEQVDRILTGPGHSLFPSWGPSPPP